MIIIVWIYNVGPVTTNRVFKSHYEYAIVTNYFNYPVTVLVRDPELFAQRYEVRNREIIIFFCERNT